MKVIWNKKGCHIFQSSDIKHIADKMESLYKRRIKAVAKDDNNEIIGQVVCGDLQYNEETKRNFRWTWYLKKFGGKNGD